MSFPIGSFKAVLGIDTGDYTRGILSAQATTAVFGQSFVNFITNPVLGSIGLFKDFAGSLVSASGDILATAKSVAQLSDITGVSAETTQALTEAMKQAGLGAMAGQNAFTQFNARLGNAKKDGGALVDTMRQLGIDMTNLGSGEGAFRRVVDQLSAIEDASIRAAAANELFGNQAGAVIAHQLSEGSRSIDDLFKKYEALGLISGGETLASLASMEAKIGDVNSAVEGMSRGLTTEFLLGMAGQADLATASMGELATKIKNDFTPAAREFGEMVGNAVRGLSELVGKINEIENAASTANEWGYMLRNRGGVFARAAKVEIPEGAEQVNIIHMPWSRGVGVDRSAVVVPMHGASR